DERHAWQDERGRCARPAAVGPTSARSAEGDAMTLQATDLVLYEERDGLAIVTLNRPEKMNTLNEAVIAGLVEAVARATASEEARAVILRGAGRTFTAGYDLNPAPGGPARPSRY